MPAWDWGGGFLLGEEGWSEGGAWQREGREMEKKEQGRKKRQEVSAPPWLSPRLASRRQTAAFPFGSESPSGRG